MAKKNTFTFKDGRITAVSMLQVTHEYECKCGQRSTLTLEWPENLVQNGTLTVGNSLCPGCQSPVVLPAAKHWVEGFRLMSEPLPPSP